MTNEPSDEHRDEDDEERDQPQPMIYEHEEGSDIIAEQLTPTEEGTIVEQLRRVEKPSEK